MGNKTLYLNFFVAINRIFQKKNETVQCKILKWYFVEYYNFRTYFNCSYIYESWNFNSGNYLFTTDTK